jgi:MFS family permease
MTHSKTARRADRKATSSLARTLVVCLALLLEGMSASSINVQVGEIRTDLDLGATSLALVAAAFLVAYAGLLPTAGRLVDARDRRVVFLAGVALFGLGCLCCAVAAGAGMLVVGRATQGVGAALSAPAALALITHGLPEGGARNRAVAIYGGMGAAGFSLGLVLPGFAVSALGWRASFAVLLPVVAAVLIASWRVPGGVVNRDQRIDYLGAALLTGALILSVHAISAMGTLPLVVSAAEGAGAAALIGLLTRRGGVAGFPGRVVFAPRVLAACLALGSIFAAALAGYYVISLSLQAAGTHDPFQVGLALLPNPVAFAALAGVGARSVTRLGAGPILAAGIGLITLALAFLATHGLTAPALLGMVPAQVAIGAGLALAFPAATILAVDAAPEEFRGTTAGLLTTWQNVGGATGLALVTALGLVPTQSDPAARAGLLACAACLVIGGACAWIVAQSRRAAVSS